jgi:hypothetical protein
MRKIPFSVGVERAFGPNHKKGFVCGSGRSITGNEFRLKNESND